MAPRADPSQSDRARARGVRRVVLAVLGLHLVVFAAKAAYGGEAQSPMIAKLLEDLLSTDLRAPGFPARLE